MKCQLKSQLGDRRRRFLVFWSLYFLNLPEKKLVLLVCYTIICCHLLTFHWPRN